LASKNTQQQRYKPGQHVFHTTLAKLIEEFQRFPGVGPKSAQRMAFYVLGMSSESVQGFAHALLDAKERVKNCSICFHLSAENSCEICTNDRRDKTVMCVVAESRDVVAANTKAVAMY